MSGPLEVHGVFSEAWSLALAVLIGALFGFVLERAGLGSARKLTGIFYLQDFAVPKVMLTAILVGMVGLLALDRLGLLDLDLVVALPTYLWPQLVGGLLLGIGFVVGGYCPGTSAVAAASGKGDALAFMSGLVVGIYAFAELFDRLESFYWAGHLGDVTLPDWLGLPAPAVAAFLLAAAGGAFWAVGRFEQRLRPRARVASREGPAHFGPMGSGTR